MGSRELIRLEKGKINYTDYGWGGRIRTYGTRDQNPLPYRLATPQQYCCNILADMIQENLFLLSQKILRHYQLLLFYLIDLIIGQEEA